VLGYTEDTWSQIFREHGATYVNPKLDLFTGAIQTACGVGRSAAGPFYCPADRKVYIDLGFFRLMGERFHESGEFAQAYVIAHEVGHHVQNLLGISDKVDQARRGASETQANAMSVRLELQADCLAGVWGHSSMQRNIIDAKDVESGMAAAAAVGDDRIQKQTRGYVVPEGFTHGSSAQRVKWFRTGLDSGDLRQCDTFATRSL
jgi:predicted metalloprotease